MVTCEYPIGGELCLAMCVAASSVLNRRGAALPTNDPDLTDCLDTLTTTIATQLKDIRTAHRQGEDPKPFADRLRAALESARRSLPGAQAQVVAGSLVSQIYTAINSALSGPRAVDGCCLFASALADEAYGRYADMARPTVSFVIKPDVSDLSWHKITSKVAGTTTLEDRPGSTIVCLTLSLRLPWRAALDAIPYVLAHECVAHAFRGPGDSTDDTDPGSEFAEGWMDRVALLLLLRAIKAGAASGLPRPWSDVRDLDIRVAGAHQDRLEPRSPDPFSMLRSKWEVGHCAAVALEGSIGRIIWGDWAAAQDEFLRLSLLLNASDISPLARDKLARKVYFADDSDDQGRAWLDDQVRAWLADGQPPLSLLSA
jgi:hypothetical protein